MNKYITDLFSGELVSGPCEPEHISYYYREFKNGFYMTIHSHDSIEIMYVNKGVCKVVTNINEYHMDSGDFIIINCDKPHQLIIDKDSLCKMLCLEFRFVKVDNPSNSLLNVKKLYENIKSVRLLLESGENLIILKDRDEILAILEMIVNELGKEKAGYNYFLQAAYSQLIIKISRLYEESKISGENPVNIYVKQAIEYMKTNYFDEITVDLIAKTLNINASYFFKLFKKQMAMTPIEYLTSIRINKAIQLLENSNLTITEVCNMTGFNSLQYFSYAFKKNIGMTPSEYRRNLKIQKDLREYSNLYKNPCGIYLNKY